LPPAFASPDWPDGNGDNPLYVKQRYGPSIVSSSGRQQQDQQAVDPLSGENPFT